MAGGIRIGLGGAILLAILSLLFRRNLFTLLEGPAQTGGGVPSRGGGPIEQTPEERREVGFVSFVLDDAQNTWARIFEARGRSYTHAKLVLFRDVVRSACGTADTAVGPFYCPGDQKVYLDLSFFHELAQRFGAPGEFAQAYVIAHEIGHHVQHVLGLDERIRAMQRDSPSETNALSVRLELQADCLAGVWGHSTEQRNLLERGDVEAGLAAAAAVGDDQMQRNAGRAVQPDKFSHGSSMQRTYWFRRGLERGDIDACDTLAASR
jgi:predicted metalloprotease